MPSFRELMEETNRENLVDNLDSSIAASKILTAHYRKDHRICVRVNSTTFNSFSEINAKLGASNSSIINMLISEYVLKHRALLDRTE